jgi:hypothetical protein
MTVDRKSVPLDSDEVPPKRREGSTGAKADEHIGAVEGDRPTDPQHGNPNADALDEEGMPKDTVAICEDVLGANVDGTEG